MAKIFQYTTMQADTIQKLRTKFELFLQNNNIDDEDIITTDYEVAIEYYVKDDENE